MQSREDYNEFLAVHVLNNEHCHSEINTLAQKPEFTNFLSGLLSLMSKPYPFNINANEYDPYLVREETIKNIRFVLRVKREGLEAEALEKLEAIELSLMDGYIRPFEMPKLPHPESLYYGQPTLPVNYQTTHNPDNIYAFFEKENLRRNVENVISLHVANNHKSLVVKPLPFTQTLSKTDLHDIAHAISRQAFKVNSQWINDILKTPSCFTADVSKKEFAQVLDAGRRSVECAGYYAAFALVHHAYTTEDMSKKENSSRVVQLSDLMYGMDGSDIYAVSGSIFKLGAFAKAPLSPEEIKAIPFAFGLWTGVSELIAHDDARHIPALAEKLEIAGFIAESDFLKQSLTSKPTVRKQSRKGKEDAPSL